MVAIWTWVAAATINSLTAVMEPSTEDEVDIAECSHVSYLRLPDNNGSGASSPDPCPSPSSGYTSTPPVPSNLPAYLSTLSRGVGQFNSPSSPALTRLAIGNHSANRLDKQSKLSRSMTLLRSSHVEMSRSWGLEMDPTAVEKLRRWILGIAVGARKSLLALW